MNEQPLRTPLEEAAGVPDIWRDEVQARLERYKRRRGRRIEGAFTMRFPFPTEETAAVAPAEVDQDCAAEQFEPTVASDVAVTEDAAASPNVAEQPSYRREEIRAEQEATKIDEQSVSAMVANVAPVKEPEAEKEPDRLIELPPRPLPRRKVIAFPAPPHVQTEFIRRIADPVQPEQLRILEVPEELQAIPATPFLEGLLDAPPASASVPHPDGLELPCATLRASRRVSTALIDAAVTFAGAGLFAAGAARFLPGLPAMKFVIAGAVAISVLLWASYQYLFLVYLGRTPGMTAMHVCLQTFKGRFPDFRQRQLRVAGLYLSVLSLGMGVLWYFVDIESLCWHDRISQTFPAAADKP